MKKSKAKNRKRAAAVAGAAICSAARPITPEDVVKEADRNYNLGRKHGIEESKPSLEASQRLLLKIANQQKEMQWVADKLKAHMSLVRYDIENWRAYPSYDQMATLVKALEMVKPPNVPKLSHDAVTNATPVSMAPKVQPSHKTEVGGGIGSSAVLGD